MALPADFYNPWHLECLDSSSDQTSEVDFAATANPVKTVAA